QLGAACTGLFLGLALHAELLVLCLEDQFLLAGACLGLDPAGFGGRRLHRLRGPKAAHEKANDDTTDGGRNRHRQDDQGIHILFLPSGRACRRIVLLWALVRRRKDQSPWARWAPPWAATEPVLCCAPPRRHVVRLPRSLRRPTPRVNRPATESQRSWRRWAQSSSKDGSASARSTWAATVRQTSGSKPLRASNA